MSSQKFPCLLKKLNFVSDGLSELFNRVFRKTQKLKLVLLLSFFLLFPVQNKDWYSSLSLGETPVRQMASAAVKPQSILESRGEAFPYLSAGGVYLFDLNSRTLFYSRNADKHFYPASTTKIATALVALNTYQDNDIINILPHPAQGQVLGLQTGELYSFSNLFYGLLVQSGNDAAEVLAQAYPDGEQAFIEKMNQLLFLLKLTDTHFANPTGIDQWQHYSSPHDLALLADYALEKQEFSRAVSTKYYQISDTTGQHIINLENVNKLLGNYEGMAGVKTGWTELAGECLVSLVKKDGREIVGVVLQSSDRFGDTRKMMDWAQSNFFETTL